MQDLICWFFVYENIVALWQWLVIIGDFIIEKLAPIIIASIIAYLTYVLGQATKNLVSVTKPKPNVICTIQRSYRHGGGLNFVIRNTGTAPAFEIEASVEAYEKTPTGEKNRKFKLSILAPNQGYITLNGLKGLMNPMQFDVNVSWKSKIGGKRNKPLEYTIDNSSEGKGGWHEAGLDQIAEEIANLKC